MPTRATEFETLELRFPRGTTREASHRALTERAEYGSWELARLRLYPDGSRRAWLRRTIIRQRPLLCASVGSPASGSQG